MDKRDFFISYTASDQEWAAWIAATLQEYGYTTYIQLWDSKPGMSFESWIVEAINNSNGFIAIWSEQYAKSAHCKSEADAAFVLLQKKKHQLFLIVRVEDSPIGNVLFRPLVHLDVFDSNEELARERLLKAVGFKGYVHSVVPFPKHRESSSAFNQMYLEDFLNEIRRERAFYNSKWSETSDKLDRILNLLNGDGLSTQINAEHIHFADRISFNGTSQINVGHYEDDDKSNFNNNDTNLYEYDPSTAMIREMFHLTKTPLMSIRFAVENFIELSQTPLSDSQIQFLNSIKDDAKLVSIIIGEYRRLATEIPIDAATYTGDNIECLLNAVLASACRLNKKNLCGNISTFPNEISNHGNHFAVVLLKPLIDNAVEAAPDGTEIKIDCDENDDSIIVTIENYCGDSLPLDEDLHTDGFTTKTLNTNGKPGGGEGLSGIRRIASKHRIGFKIHSDQKTNKVIATLQFPKK